MFLPSTQCLCVGLGLGCFPSFCVTPSYEGVYLNKPRISYPIQTGDSVLHSFPGAFHSGARVPTPLKEAQGLPPSKLSILTPGLPPSRRLHEWEQPVPPFRRESLPRIMSGHLALGTKPAYLPIILTPWDLPKAELL